MEINSNKRGYDTPSGAQVRIDNVLNELNIPLRNLVGTTSDRLATTNLNVGSQYFDTTLGKPVWLKATAPSKVWVDATGATV
jgi:hypothetical protein